MRKRKFIHRIAVSLGLIYGMVVIYGFSVYDKPEEVKLIKMRVTE